MAHLKTGRLLVAVMAVAAALALVACSSGSGSGSTGTPATSEDGPAVVRNSDTFDVGSFVSAGWKKSKEFSTETVPESTSIWYGFYKGQDVEIRFYKSHEDALGPGVESASAAVNRVPNANLQGNAIFASGQRAQYNDFMVAGNAVILCQSDITICADMVENVP